MSKPAMGTQAGEHFVDAASVAVINTKIWHFLVPF